MQHSILRSPIRARRPTSSFWVLLLVVSALAAPGFASSGATAVSLAHWDFARSNVLPSATEVCSTTALCPSTVLGAYSIAGLVSNGTTNGTGQTVVIVDACGDSKIATDLATFDSANSLPPANLTVYTPQGTPCSDPTGWGLETALDVEWAHALAPGASIALVEAKSASNTNLFGAWNYSLVHHLGNQISNSWGGTGSCPSIAKNLLAKASTAHVSILASSGDGGAWGSGQRLGAQQPADCQSVVTVGGTTLKVSTNGSYKSEAAWSGSGGGYSPSTTEPSYQTKSNITDSYSELGKPDVAAVADPSTGVWVYEASSGGWLTVGGTSVACPIWAGYFADVNSWRAANKFSALGNVDPFLYSSIYGVNGAGANYAKDFHDVTTGSNGWSAGTGWDAATGLGSFQGSALASLLASSAKA
jgi:subtilase family serine protease